MTGLYHSSEFPRIHLGFLWELLGKETLILWGLLSWWDRALVLLLTILPPEKDDTSSEEIGANSSHHFRIKAQVIQRPTQKTIFRESHLGSVWSPALIRGETQNLGPDAFGLIEKHILPGTWAGAQLS